MPRQFLFPGTREEREKRSSRIEAPLVQEVVSRGDVVGAIEERVADVRGIDPMLREKSRLEGQDHVWAGSPAAWRTNSTTCSPS